MKKISSAGENKRTEKGIFVDRDSFSVIFGLVFAISIGLIILPLAICAIEEIKEALFSGFSLEYRFLIGATFCGVSFFSFALIGNFIGICISELLPQKLFCFDNNTSVENNYFTLFYLGFFVAMLLLFFAFRFLFPSFF
ncbi:hypothetical protein CQA49_06675 [Helicobacter sp. MIT 00-7814]|uniref:hypothetical protein n=1 Tax=unclassified Helicobacter TaxID=2593540 RepID=UPI000E1EA109|nr:MULTISPECIES: hypothetical protein [unclassified Helicobacter]RDU53327.1 hypothetical protein CQA49_06675 [Helicobacter sp. MIT 00-7814]RDU54148.1 hypothetical protein CQA37_05915 [Helicobacter sp. MIT 99-10781]